MPQTYNFTVPSSSRAAERLAKDPASANGTVYEAIALALLYNVRVELADKQGVARGHVEAGGKSWSVR